MVDNMPGALIYVIKVMATDDNYRHDVVNRALADIIVLTEYSNPAEWIKACKKFREITGCGLSEARDAINAAYTRHILSEEDPEDLLSHVIRVMNNDKKARLFVKHLFDEVYGDSYEESDD